MTSNNGENSTSLRVAAVTGASGMIGSRICKTIDTSPGWSPAIRLARNISDKPSSWRAAPDLSKTGDWNSVLSGADAVIHCAARAHILKETISPEAATEAFFAANHFGALQVAKAALEVGARHFVFISSAGVVAGEAADKPALEHSEYSPLSTYAKAKQRAEEDLISLFEHSPCKLIILRPPLVIAKGAPGNVGLLERMANWLPIDPFTDINNCRSVISCTNLSAATLAACNLQSSETEIFHTVELSPVSTSTLIKNIRSAKGKSTVKLPIPAKILAKVFTLLRREELYDKVFGNFQLDDTNARARLGNYHSCSIVEELEFDWRENDE